MVIRHFRPGEDMGHVGCDTDDNLFFFLGSDMDFGYYRTDTAFEICSPANVVILLFQPWEDTGHVGCDTEYGVFPRV